MKAIRNSRGGRAWCVVAIAALMVSAGCGSTHSDDELRAAQSARPTTEPDGTGTTLPTPSGEAPSAGSDLTVTTAGSAVADPGSQSPPSQGTGSGPKAQVPPPGAAAGGSTGAAAAPGSGKATGSGTPEAPATSGAADPRQPGVPVPAAPASPTGPKAEIVLGSVGTESGVIGELLLPTVQGAKAWVADVNARGGLNGHPVKIIFGDDGGEPSRALALARQMVEQNQVVAFFAERGPGTFQAVAPYLEQNSIPVIAGCMCDVAAAQSPMSFQVGPAGDLGLAWSQTLPLLEYSDKRKVSIIYCRESASCPNARARIVKFAAQAGIQVVHEAQSSISAPDYTAEVLAARNSGAEAILALLDNLSLVRLIRSAHRQNWNPVVTGQVAVHDERFLKNGGSDIEGVIVSAGFPHWDSPKMADFRAAMRRFIPGGGILGSWSQAPWVGGKLLEVVAKGFPAQPTKQDFLRGLYALNGETLGGLIPPLTYKPGQGSDTNLCAVMTKVEKSKFVPKNGDNFSCAPGWKPVTR